MRQPAKRINQIARRAKPLPIGEAGDAAAA
jgi:hypothetical protein